MSVNPRLESGVQTIGLSSKENIYPSEIYDIGLVPNQVSGSRTSGFVANGYKN